MAQRNNTKTLIMSSMLAALVFAVTCLIVIPVPKTSAYVNMGDSVIYCMGLLVGAPWAAIAAGIGSMLADWALGFAIYMPATLVIKGLMGFVCALLLRRNKKREINNIKDSETENGKSIIRFITFILISILGGLIMVTGYAAYEVFFMGGLGYIVTTLIGNLIQLGGGVAGAVALYYPVKRIKSLL